MANLFRSFLHAAAHNLLVRLRQNVANPPERISTAEIPSESLSEQARNRVRICHEIPFRIDSTNCLDWRDITRLLTAFIPLSWGDELLTGVVSGGVVERQRRHESASG